MIRLLSRTPLVFGLGTFVSAMPAGIVAVSGTPAATVSVGTPFTLRLAESSLIEGVGLTVRFDSVPADSRCPVEVHCVWSGVATAILVVGREGSPATELTLDTLGTTGTAENLRFSVVKLDPSPSINRPTANYVGLFLAEPAAP
jgi:hypothetical protein